MKSYDEITNKLANSLKNRLTLSLNAKGKSDKTHGMNVKSICYSAAKSDSLLELIPSFGPLCRRRELRGQCRGSNLGKTWGPLFHPPSLGDNFLLTLFSIPLTLHTKRRQQFASNLLNRFQQDTSCIRSECLEHIYSNKGRLEWVSVGYARCTTCNCTLRFRVLSEFKVYN